MKWKRKLRFAAAAALAVCICCMFTGCKTGTAVDTLLTINQEYAGTRTMTFRFSQSTAESENGSALDRIIQNYCPAQLTYEKQGDDYVFTLRFTSRKDYIEKTAALLGTQPTVLYAQPDTVFTDGYRISEDFTSAALFAWLQDAIKAENQGKELPLHLQGGRTQVCFDGKTQQTGDEITLNRVSGCAVDKIQINTVHHGDLYDRTITFQIPRKTINALGEDVVSYMNARTDASAVREWKDFASGREYTVTYKNVSLQQLLQYTNMLFNSQLSGQAFYGADDEGASPFIKRNQFEETLDVSAYITANGGSVPVEYTYSLQGDTVLAQGRVYRGGKWQTAGSVYETGYTVQNETASLHVRIPDAVTYPVKDTEITVSCEGNGIFERTVAFRFDKADTQGAQYAEEYLKKRITPELVTQQPDEKGVRCAVTVKGSAEEISRQMTALFGKGNTLTYQSEGGGLDVHNATAMEDRIRMARLYADGNENSPIAYVVRTNGKEQLNDLRYASEHIISKVRLNAQEDGAESGVVRFTLNSADTVITYNGYTPRALGIAVYFFFAFCVIAAVIFIIVLIKRHGDGKPPLLRRRKALTQAHSANAESVEEILAKI